MRLLTLNPKKFLISRAYVKTDKYSSAFDDVDDDGEMGVGEDHLELVSDGDSGDHVSNSASDGAESSVSLFLLKPHSELKSFLSGFLEGLLPEFEGDVSEGSGDFAEWAANGDVSGFDINLDSVGDRELLFSDDVLHSYLVWL